MSTTVVRAALTGAFIVAAGCIATSGVAHAQASESAFSRLQHTRSGVAQQAGAPLRYVQHTAWLGENGPPLPGVHQLMRSPDGYLWLGGQGGLMRFDGVRFVIIDSTVTPALKASAVGLFLPQFVDREGWLWFSRPDGGLVQYRDGKYRVVRQPEADVGRFATLDGAGRIWLSGVSAHLRVLHNGRAERASLPPGVPDTGVTGIVRDTGQGIWIGTQTQGLFHVAGSRVEHIPTFDTRQPIMRPLLQSSDGIVWALGSNGAQLYRLVRGRWLPVSLSANDQRLVLARAAVEDGTHAVWIGTLGHGVLRWRDGAFEQFSKEDGLSDASVDDLLPGEGGSMWILTRSGALERLRPASFVTVDHRDEPALESAYRFVGDEHGSLWGTGAGENSLVVEVRGGVVDGTRGRVRVTRAALPANEHYEVLRGARGGGVWLGLIHGGLIRYRHGTVSRWTERDGLPGKRFWLALETRDNAVWLATVPNGGFGRLRNGKYLPIALPGAPDARVTGAVEDGRGHLWVSVADSAFVYQLVGDRVVRRFGAESGMSRAVDALTLERGDTLWGITGDSGVVRIAGGRVAFIRTPMLRRTLFGRAALAASGSDLWIVGSGVVRLPLTSLHAVADGKEGSGAPRFFLASDGISSPRSNHNSPDPLFRARDGRVWISTPAGLSVVDPSQQFVESTPPQLHIEELSSSGRMIPRDGSPEISPRPASVSIRYTAISLLAPERTRIQYRLDGADDSWIDGIGPRVATYALLRPGMYTFRLRAWNVDGTRSARDETLTFRVLPAWHETAWSRVGGVLLIALVGAAGAASLQQRRARRSAEIIQSRFDAMLSERTRVARELHDTLLGDMAGVAMQLKAGAGRAAATGRADATIVELLSALSTQVQRSLVEARRSVTAMRTSPDELPALHEQLANAAHRTFAGTDIAAHVEHAGAPRPAPAIVEAEILGITTEAMTNAPDMEIVAEAGNGAEAVALFEAERPDVVLMDLQMPKLDGVSAIRAIRTIEPHARVIALTTYEGDADIHRALSAGACAYLMKDAMIDQLVAAIRSAAAGKRVIPAQVAGKLAEFTPRADLTARELEVLQHVARGLGNREIAHAIGWSTETVKAHLENIFEKLDARDRTHAVTIALQRGFLHLAE